MTPQQLERSRFEDYMREHWPLRSLKRLPDDSCYAELETFWMHKGWQASRESLVVELPKVKLT